jgi:hypothetical protein
MTILYDPSSRGLARFGASGMPAHYVVDERGVVRFAASGYTPERVGALAAAIDRVLAERSTSR